MTQTLTIDDALFAAASRALQASEPQEVIQRALILAIGSAPEQPEIEIYTGDRMTEFAQEEAKLEELLRRKKLL